MFNENKDDINSYYTPPSDASGGAAISGIEAIDRAYEANARASSSFAIAHAVGVEQERINADLVKSGEEPLPKTWYSSVNKGDEGPDLNTVTALDETGREFSGAQWSVVQYNQRISELRKNHHDLDLPLVGEQFDRVKKKAEEAKTLQEKTHYSGLGGYAGAFAGQVAADMNPALNPVNTVSLGVGGFGKSIAMRIGTEVGVNAGVEFVNEATGVNEQRRLLGLPEASTGEMIGQAAVAGVGAGVIRGVGEGIGVLAKKWFPNLAHDPAPPPRPENLRFGDAPPTHLSPDDLEHVVSRQYSDFERAADPNINAHTVTQDSLYGESRSAVGRFETDLSHVERAFNEGEAIVPPSLDAQGRTVDALARETDPDTFRMYDRIREEQAKVRSDLEGQIAYEKRVNGDNVSEVTRRNMQEKRDYIQFLDEKARDLAPLMGRAYAHAEGAWVPSEVTREAVDRMVAEKTAVLPERGAKGNAGKTIESSSNFMSDENKAIVERHGGATVGESETQALVRTANKALDETDRVLDKSVTELPDRISKNELPEGLPKGMDLDQVVHLGPLDDNGNATPVTLREFLQDSVDDELEMKAVSVCSLKAS